MSAKTSNIGKVAYLLSQEDPDSIGKITSHTVERSQGVKVLITGVTHSGRYYKGNVVDKGSSALRISKGWVLYPSWLHFSGVRRK